MSSAAKMQGTPTFGKLALFFFVLIYFDFAKTGLREKFLP
jgi:hypothetical protein